MNLHGLLLCVHMAFTIDRVEETFAIVEWMGTTEMSDLDAGLFPQPPKEGERWLIHLKPSIHHDAKAQKLNSRQGDHIVGFSLSPSNLKPYQIRMTRITNQPTLKEFKL